MNLANFQELLDQHGPAPARWPSGRKEAALALSEQSPEARQLLAGALELEGLARAALAVQTPPVLKARILDAVSDARGPAWLEWFTGSFWNPAVAASVLLLLGFALGFVTPGPGLAMSDDEIVFFSTDEVDQLTEFANASAY